MMVAPGRHFTGYNHQNSSVFFIVVFLSKQELLYFKQWFKKKAKTKLNMLVVVKSIVAAKMAYSTKSQWETTHIV